MISQAVMVSRQQNCNYEEKVGAESLSLECKNMQFLLKLVTQNQKKIRVLCLHSTCLRRKIMLNYVVRLLKTEAYWRGFWLSLPSPRVEKSVSLNTFSTEFQFFLFVLLVNSRFYAFSQVDFPPFLKTPGSTTALRYKSLLILPQSLQRLLKIGDLRKTVLRFGLFQNVFSFI